MTTASVPAPSTQPLSAPSDWVMRWAVQWARGARVLDLACGSGRHMAALAGLGLQPCGVDRDPLALAQAAQWGPVVCADLEACPWPLVDAQGQAQRFDAVVVCNYLWRALWPPLLHSVQPGGWLVYETFAQGHEALGRPSRPDFLLQAGELLRVCAGWDVVAFEAGELSDPPRRVQRIAARAPPLGAQPLAPARLARMPDPQFGR